MKKEETLLMVAESEHDANMLYAVGMFVPDPFIYLRIKGRGAVVMNDLEIDRAKRDASHCKVISLSSIQSRLKQGGIARPGFADVIAILLRDQRITTVCAPYNFPLGLANDLGRKGIKVRNKDGGFFPDREVKKAAEVKKISAALMMAEVGLAEAIQVLKRSKVGKNRRLLYHGNVLTAEKLRSTIDTAILQAGGLAANTIVACGVQGCDPHERGSGPLKAHEPIIIDVFPRSQKTGYFGDITRTVVKGKASDTIKKMYTTVQKGQEIAFHRMRAGVDGFQIHKAVQDFFIKEGFKTGKKNGRMEGFFHGTGHGLGLEIHEAPRVGPTSVDRLKTGHVVTVEPGLYYPPVGGIRLEDVALVGVKNSKNLTHFEKVLELY